MNTLKSQNIMSAQTTKKVCASLNQTYPQIQSGCILLEHAYTIKRRLLDILFLLQEMIFFLAYRHRYMQLKNMVNLIDQQTNH